MGGQLAKLAAGDDSRPVVADPPRKSVGAEETFERDLVTVDEIARALLRLSDRVSSRLRSQGISGQTVNVKVRFANFVTLTRAKTLPREVDSTAPIFATAKALCTKAIDSRSTSPRVRLLGVSVSQLGEWPASEQISLEDEPRWSAAEGALDEIRAKFGDTAVTLGTLLS
jgi:DNA polymerase-4